MSIRYFRRIAAWVILIPALTALVLGYLGALHPALDSLAIGRVGAGLVVIVMAPLALGWRGVIGAALVAGSLVPLIPWDRGEAGPITVYSKNLYFRNTQTAPIVADILEVAPDVVVLQEVATRQMGVLADLGAHYPHQFYCRTARWNGIAVLSRFEILEGSANCSPARAFARVQLDGPQGRFWVVGVHLEWPWPKQQALMVDISLPQITGLAGDVIVAGDFNTVPWSAVARRIGEVTGTRPLSPRLTTFWLGWVPLPLDQVWATCGGRVERRGRFSSDHHGVVARVFAGNCD